MFVNPFSAHSYIGFEKELSHATLAQRVHGMLPVSLFLKASSRAYLLGSTSTRLRGSLRRRARTATCPGSMGSMGSMGTDRLIDRSRVARPAVQAVLAAEGLS